MSFVGGAALLFACNGVCSSTFDRGIRKAWPHMTSKTQKVKERAKQNCDEMVVASAMQTIERAHIYATTAKTRENALIWRGILSSYFFNAIDVRESIVTNESTDESEYEDDGSLQIPISLVVNVGISCADWIDVEAKSTRDVISERGCSSRPSLGG